MPARASAPLWTSVKHASATDKPGRGPALPAPQLGRLLAPASIVFVGGDIAAMAISRCKAAGFAGRMYAVHPTRSEVGGLATVTDVSQLPEVPDAAFIGVNREATVAVVQQLSAMGTGGCVCYAAGFDEVGDKGGDLQQRLVQAAGSMPLIGPNCFGYVNYADRCALWPYLFGDSGTEGGPGVAVISQSGNIAMNLTMNQREVRFTHVITTGNQAVLGPAAYIEALLDDSRVRAIGMYLEGLDDPAAFCRAALRALRQAVPIVVLKVGRTAASAERASSHTSSLTGSDLLHDALFERLGVLRVDSLPALLETLKFLDIVGPLQGTDVLSLSCSGGEAAIMADLTARFSLSTPPLSPTQVSDLEAQFPGYVTVSNPFDYNTSIWGDRPAMERCFTSSLAGSHHLALMVNDHPTVESPEVEEWFDAVDAFVCAHDATGMPAAVVCTISELLPHDLRRRLRERGVAPMQGLEEALIAARAAAHYGKKLRAPKDIQLPAMQEGPGHDGQPGTLLDEWQSKQWVAAAGVNIPTGFRVPEGEVLAAARKVGFPVALKACGAEFAHKSEQRAVVLSLPDEARLLEAVADLKLRLGCSRFLVEAMVERPVAELLVGLHRDPQFGLSLVLGSGGVLVELVADSASLLLPTNEAEVLGALERLKVWKLLQGYRGSAPADLDAVVAAVLAIAGLAGSQGEQILELDINPLMVLAGKGGVVAADALMRVVTGGNASES
ncbi:MAG: acetate--CoA ligase family protein [Steroidobacteraceae bacterium]